MYSYHLNEVTKDTGIYSEQEQLEDWVLGHPWNRSSEMKSQQKDWEKVTIEGEEIKEIMS